MLGLLVMAGSLWAFARGHLPAVGICPQPTGALVQSLNGTAHLRIADRAGLEGPNGPGPSPPRWTAPARRLEAPV